MSEDSERDVLDAAQHDPLLLEYDHLKHLTTLSLVALGGVLSLAQSQQKLGNTAMLVAVFFVAGGGGLALSALEQIVKAKRTGVPPGRIYRWSRAGANSLFSLGVGAFLAIFLKLFQ